MRRDRYLEKFPEHVVDLRRIAMNQGLAHDEANEVLSICAERFLHSKKYIPIVADKLKAFLRSAIRFGVKEFKKKALKQKLLVARLREPEESDYDRSVPVLTEVTIDEIERECPFCFLANLNEYGACHMCHTILPANFHAHRKVIVLTEESLAVEFDFNTPIDVQKAIARLTPHEQRIVRAIGMGNETLESFAELDGKHFTTIGRDWAKAKAKLQEYLKEYANDSPSKRGQKAFQKAVQRIEKAEKNDVR